MGFADIPAVSGPISQRSKSNEASITSLETEGKSKTCLGAENAVTFPTALTWSVLSRQGRGLIVESWPPVWLPSVDPSLLRIHNGLFCHAGVEYASPSSQLDSSTVAFPPAAPISIHPSYLTFADMVRKTFAARELLAQAEANGYKKGNPKEQDKVRGRQKHVEKTKKDHDAALNRYVLYVRPASPTRRETRSNAGPPDRLLATWRETLLRKGCLVPVKPWLDNAVWEKESKLLTWRPLKPSCASTFPQAADEVISS